MADQQPRTNAAESEKRFVTNQCSQGFYGFRSFLHFRAVPSPCQARDSQLLRNTLRKFFCLRQLETERGGSFFQVVNQTLPILLLINLYALADVSIAML